MLPTIASVELARWQFAIAASFHFLFVPFNPWSYLDPVHPWN